jgi:hypothetical protein
VDVGRVAGQERPLDAVPVHHATVDREIGHPGRVGDGWS